MSLRAIASFAGKEKQGDMQFDYKIGNGKTVTASTGLPFARVAIPISGTGAHRLHVQNKGSGALFARLITTGTPARGEEKSESHGLAMRVGYIDMNGDPIDPSQLPQATQFFAAVSIRHPGIRGPYENLALSQVFPSGWEINNLRLDGLEEFLEGNPYTYQDIRDDRVFTYFDLAPHEEKTFVVMITAAYSGEYYLPAVSCEAMYDRSIYARMKGGTVEVVKAGP